MHEFEYLWKAGCRVYKEGRQELADWVEEKKDLLHAGRIDKILNELQERLGVPTSYPHSRQNPSDQS